MRFPTRTRALLGGVAFAVVVAGVAVAVGRSGGGDLRRLALAPAGSAAAETAASMAMLAPAVDLPLEADLSGLPARGPGFELVGRAGASDAARLARALGMEGDPVPGGGGGWTVIDGSARLDLQPGPGGSWHYLADAGPVCGPDSAVSSDGETTCGERPSDEVGGVEPQKGGTEPGAPGGERDAATMSCPSPCPPDAQVCAAVCAEPGEEGELAEPGQPVRPADLPDEAGAERIARETFARLGLDLTGASVRVSDGGSTWYVSADPAVGGLPTVGLAWSLEIGGKGVVRSAGGFLLDVEHLGDYPLVGPGAALERLAAAGNHGAPEPLIARCEGEACEEPASHEEALEPRIVTVVRLGLVPGDGVLVPAWFLHVKGDPYPTPVVAVADEYLAGPTAR